MCDMDSNRLPDHASARDRLLAATEQLIYSGGIHATGIDAIVRLSGAARKSMYACFASKHDLVAAALGQRDERWMNWFSNAVEAGGGSARDRLLAMFDVLRNWFAADGFHGCAFLNAAGEIGKPDDPIRRVSLAHKARLLAYIEHICVEYDREQKHPPNQHPKPASVLARQWLVLIDGAIGVALVSGKPDAALDARSIAQSLLDHSM
jgi:AcrR family transcriptional regulator